MNNCAANPMKTRADKVRLGLDLIRPLLPCLSAGGARWLRLQNMVKSDDPSAFPSLTQWEVFGADIEAI